MSLKNVFFSVICSAIVVLLVIFIKEIYLYIDQKFGLFGVFCFFLFVLIFLFSSLSQTVSELLGIIWKNKKEMKKDLEDFSNNVKDAKEIFNKLKKEFTK